MKKDLNPKQQIVDAIKRSKSILLLTHTHPDGDAVASVLAWKLVLEKLGKGVEAMIPDEIPADYNFLPTLSTVLRETNIKRDLVISIREEGGKVGKISYHRREDNGIDLIVSPSEGVLKPENLSATTGKFGYDLLIILDTPDWERVSEVYEKNKDLFQDISTVNIDHHSTNQYFGEFNLIDTNATSTCEILVSLAEALGSPHEISQSDNFAKGKIISRGKDLIGSEVATLLLTGIISDTNRFQNANTTPKSLTVAAQLIAAGARRSEIIKNIYRTHPVSTLKLWGKVLSNIKEDKEYGIVWSTLGLEEIREAGARESEANEVVNELLMSAPEAKVVLLLTEREFHIVNGSLRTADEVAASEIALVFAGGGHKQAAGFKLEGVGLAEAERMVLEKIRKYLSGGKEIRSQEKSRNEAKILFEERPQVPFPRTQGGEKPNIAARDEDVYSPSLSDIEQDQPKIADNGTSILQRVMDMKKKEKIDFAKLEEETLRAYRLKEPEARRGGRKEEGEVDEDYE